MITEPPTLTDSRSTVTVSEAAEASSAHARVNIPLNLENWRALPEAIQQDLLWFHQHLLNKNLDLDAGAEAIGYDRSTVYRALKGTYEGSWPNIAKAIQSYRKLDESRGAIQKNEFTENRITRRIFGALSYALTNNLIAIIIGESRLGKSVASDVWRDRNNHGRAVKVIAPAYGGTKALFRCIAAAVGVNKNLSAHAMPEAIHRAFNKNRILIVDEAHRLLPGDRRANPTNLEILRDLHDQTGCALALVATARFESELYRSEYMFEQLLGRGLVVKLAKKIIEADIEGILRQYVARPTKALIEACIDIANKPGRLAVLVENLKVASTLAKKKGEKLSDVHVFTAIKIREELKSEA